MDRKYFQNSDYTNIYHYLKFKIPSWILFIPLISNAICFLFFTSLLDSKITNRKLALKLRISHNNHLFLLFLPLFLLELFIVIFFSINYYSYNFNYTTFVLTILACPIIFIILNPVFLFLRNKGIEKILQKMAIDHKIIENPYQITTIKSWEKYINNYRNAYKGNAFFRASDDFKPVVNKIQQFNESLAERENRGSKNLNDLYYALNPSDLFLKKYFGSLFISTNILYLYVLLLNFHNTLNKELKIINKYFINLSINLIFFTYFAFALIFFKYIPLNIFIPLTTTNLFLYWIIALIKSIAIRKSIKFQNYESKSNKVSSISDNFLSLNDSIYEINQKDKNFYLINNLKKINKWNVLSVIWPTIFIGIIFIILASVFFPNDFNRYWIISIGVMLFGFVYNYSWILFMFLLAKKQKLIFSTKEKLLILLCSIFSVSILERKTTSK